MASTQIQTTSLAVPFWSHGHGMALTGSRLWAGVLGGSGSNSGVNLYRSDNDGTTWTAESDLSSASNLRPTVAARQVSGTWQLHGTYGSGGAASQALTHFKITSNVDTGTPGAVTQFTVDAGGANAGVFYPVPLISPTTTNGRVWMLYGKQTAATPTYEMRAAYALLSDTTTWSTTNFTDLLGGASPTLSRKWGAAAYWKVGGADKVTFVMYDTSVSPNRFRAVTFDPTAATPTPGSGTNFATFSSTTGLGSEDDAGPRFFLCGRDDYLVFGRIDPATSTWDLFKTVNGTTWTQPSGWAGLSDIGRAAASTDGTDIFLVHSSTVGAASNTVSDMVYRRITAASDTVGAPTSFTDTQGNPVAVPRDTGASKLYAMYRAGTTSLYSVRSDVVAIGAGVDTTPPSLTEDLTATPASSGTQIDLAWTHPSDTDMSHYEIRAGTADYPPSDRSSGTVVVSQTAATPGTAGSFSHTGLTAGSRRFYRVYHKDTSGNWNTGAQVTAVAATPMTSLGFLTSAGAGTTGSPPNAGANPIWRLQTAAGNFEAGLPAHIRVRIGDTNSSPPTDSTGTPTDLLSATSTAAFTYDSGGGVFVAWPTSGLPTASFGAEVRVSLPISGLTFYVAARVEQ